MTIASLLVVSVVSSTRTVMDARASIESRVADSSEARRAVESIVAALRNVRRDMGPDGHVIVGTARKRDALGDTIDLLVVDTRRARDEGAESDQYEISFSLVVMRGREQPALICRRDHALDDKPDEGGIAMIVAEGIAGLRFMYYDGTDWQDDWSEDQRGTPLAVRVSVQSAGTDRTESVTFSTVVAIAAARVSGANMGGQP